MENGDARRVSRQAKIVLVVVWVVAAVVVVGECVYDLTGISAVNRERDRKWYEKQDEEERLRKLQIEWFEAELRYAK